MAHYLLSQGDGEGDVPLYFVIPLNLEEDDCDVDMKEAFTTAVEVGLAPTWVKEEFCLSLSPTKKTAFVFQKFEGPAFDHIKEFQCVSISGPRCLTQCMLRDVPMPTVPYPTFTAAMYGLVITCSGGGVEVKNNMREKVELMSGIFSKSFTEKTTHVVVCSVSSSKYEKAYEMEIPVRTHEWIDAVWRASLQDHVFASDEKFDKYKCPPFLNLEVCSSGLSTQETRRIKNSVLKYGGKYVTSLSASVNILVVKHAKSEKYKYARNWGVPCVSPQWIDDSVTNGHAVPHRPYEVIDRAASSPSAEKASVDFSLNVSNIHFDSRTHVDESMMNSTTSSTASFCPPARLKTPVKMAPPAQKRTPVKTPVKPCVNPADLKHLLADLNLSQTKKAGSFLDGCGVYLLGWDPEEEEQLKKILKCSGAARFTDLSDRVSHVLVGNLEKPFLRTIKALSHMPHVVNIKWLIQSVAERGPAPEEPFSCLASDNLNVTGAPSPLSKKGMALLQRENFSPQKPLVMQNNVVETKPSPNKGKQLLARYLSSESAASKSLSTSAISMPPPPVPVSMSKPPPKFNCSDKDNNESDVVASEGELFAGLKFVVVGLEDETASYVENELIISNGGTVVPKTFKGVTDYAVVPLVGTPLRQTATEIINSLWLECCIQEQTLVPFQYYHQPIVMDERKRPLEGCVLGLSGFTDRERHFILELAAALGAVCQDVFAKRSKGGAKASSHLICKTDDMTEKLKAAIKWCRPAVRHTWLLACASSGTRVPESSHLVDPDQVIKPFDAGDSSICSTANDSSLPNKSERPPRPAVAALQQLPCFKTPERPVLPHDKAEIERILNYVPSPNPYADRTPPVPLGLSDNPTPGESKRLQKWLDRLPDNEPSTTESTANRRDSTPLHELRKRILEKHGVTTPEMMQFVSDKVKERVVCKGENLGVAKGTEEGDSIRNTSKIEERVTACSTPTSNNGSTASRNLFKNVERASCIDGQLDKLHKLIATPEGTEDDVISKSTSRNKNRSNQISSNNLLQIEDQRIYDALKDGSQPYAINWEDPVNVNKPCKEEKEEASKDNNEVEEIKVEEEKHLSKRKSSECAENAPELKKCHVEVPAAKSDKAPKTYKFAFTSVDAKEQTISIISKLGGALLDSQNYDPEATHLLLEKNPQRSEKLLACIASGKWVLHVSYLIESNKRGKFVEEEDFEWGNPKNRLVAKLESGSVAEALAKASHRWRTIIAKRKSRGAFESIVCKLYTSPEKTVAFTRLITAGGGTVLPEKSKEKPLFCLVNPSTHAAVLTEYAKQGIPCLPVNYLYEHLTVDPIPDPELRTFEEYRKLRQKYLTGK